MLLESSIDTREGSGEGTRIAPRLTCSVSPGLSPDLSDDSASNSRSFPLFSWAYLSLSVAFGGNEKDIAWQGTGLGSSRWLMSRTRKRAER